MQNLLHLVHKKLIGIILSITLLSLIVGCGYRITQIRPGVVFVEDGDYSSLQTTNTGYLLLEEGYPGKDIEVGKETIFNWKEYVESGIVNAPLIVYDYDRNVKKDVDETVKRRWKSWNELTTFNKARVVFDIVMLILTIVFMFLYIITVKKYLNSQRRLK